MKNIVGLVSKDCENFKVREKELDKATVKVSNMCVYPNLQELPQWLIPVKAWANTMVTVNPTWISHCEVNSEIKWANTVSSQETNSRVSSLLPLHGELIGMISRTAHSKLTVWLQTQKKGVSHLVSSLWCHSVSSKWAFREFQCEIPVISNSSLVR